MEKKRITEEELLAEINAAIDVVWNDEKHHCLVSQLRRSHGIAGNWEVDTTHSGGNDLTRSTDCQATVESVLPNFLEKYDVDWL